MGFLPGVFAHVDQQRGAVGKDVQARIAAAGADLVDVEHPRLPRRDWLPDDILGTRSHGGDGKHNDGKKQPESHRFGPLTWCFTKMEAFTQSRIFSAGVPFSGRSDPTTVTLIDKIRVVKRCAQTLWRR